MRPRQSSITERPHSIDGLRNAFLTKNHFSYPDERWGLLVENVRNVSIKAIKIFRLFDPTSLTHLLGDRLEVQALPLLRGIPAYLIEGSTNKYIDVRPLA